MPELPEVEALAEHLRTHALARPVARVDVASMTVLKTYDPPVSSLAGHLVTGASRHGKFLDVTLEGPSGTRHLVVHLSRAGWLRWHEQASTTPPKPGKGPLQLRVHLDEVGGPGFDLTEAGTQKRLAVYLVADPREVPGVAKLGPDALEVSRPQLAELLGAQGGSRLKTVLGDQQVLAGIGNAYSDEILHVARLSPFAAAGRLDAAGLDRLHEAMVAVLSDAARRAVGQDAALLKGEKRSGMRVHARTGLPCPVCGDAVREVAFAERSFQYCPTCQTRGRTLADRRLSRLVK